MPTLSSTRVQLLSLALCAFASPVLAQMATPAPSLAEIAPPAAPAAPVGPTIASATVGYNSVSDASTEMTWNNRRAKDASGPVLAIVGGAALIGGLLIGGGAGTAIAVGGLIMGLIGLYLWLK